MERRAEESLLSEPFKRKVFAGPSIRSSSLRPSPINFDDLSLDQVEVSLIFSVFPAALLLVRRLRRPNAIFDWSLKSLWSGFIFPVTVEGENETKRYTHPVHQPLTYKKSFIFYGSSDILMGNWVKV